jgi:hypothetical protein
MGLRAAGFAVGEQLIADSGWDDLCLPAVALAKAGVLPLLKDETSSFLPIAMAGWMTP